MRIKVLKAFTLMELLIVVVCIGTVAAFAIPSYTKAVDKGYARAAVMNLAAIGAAEQVYKARYGVYTSQAPLIATRRPSDVGWDPVRRCPK